MSRVPRIETQIYLLNFVATTARGLINGPETLIQTTVPFDFKKVVFKPLNCYFTAEQAVGTSNYNPFLMFCDIYNATKAIGYSGHVSNATGAGAGAVGQWLMPSNDVTFVMPNFRSGNGLNIMFGMGAALNSGSIFSTSPFTGVVVVTVEYHEHLP